MLLPFGHLTSRARFQSSLYLKNQEYQALLGYLCGLSLLIWKAGLLT